ncbi:hypothetical protein [Streptomyces platensis]
MDAQDTEPPNLRRHGADEAEALHNGYHPSPDPPSVIRRSRAWDAREALPAEMRRAAYGRSVSWPTSPRPPPTPPTPCATADRAALDTAAEELVTAAGELLGAA